MDVRRALIAASTHALLIAGCQCGASAAIETRAEAEASAPVLPDSSQTDLSAPSPAVVVEIGDRGFRIDNAPLLATWSDAERARVPAGSAPGLPDFPAVSLAVPALAEGSRSALESALASAARAEVARGGTPPEVALRAPSEIPWDRALLVFVAAHAAGLGALQLVVQTPLGERAIRMRAAPLALSDRRAALAEAIAGLGAREGEAAVATAAPEVRLSVVIEAHGIRVSRGIVTLGPDCRALSADGSPTLTAETDLPRCLDAVGAVDRIGVTAAHDQSYGRVVQVLERLTARAPIVIALPATETE